MINLIIISVLVLLIILIIYLLNNNNNIERFYNLNGINSFDFYMYINLEHRTDRKTQLLDELSKVDIPENKITRIDAVHEKYNGHIGCAKSHLKALTLAKDKEYDNVVIFEDDFAFTLDKSIIDEKINNFLKNFGKNWDVIQLSSVYIDLKNIENISDVKKVNSATTSSAYIIQKHFYNNLINTLKESVIKMEEEMIEFKDKHGNIKKHETGYALDQYWADLQQKSKWYIFDPYLGKQSGISSSIMGDIEAFTNNIRIYGMFV